MDPRHARGCPRVHKITILMLLHARKRKRIKNEMSDILRVSQDSWRCPLLVAILPSASRHSGFPPRDARQAGDNQFWLVMPEGLVLTSSQNASMKTSFVSFWLLIRSIFHHRPLFLSVMITSSFTNQPQASNQQHMLL